MTTEQIEDAKAKLEAMVNAKPETAEQWGDICLLEQQIVDAERVQQKAV